MPPHPLIGQQFGNYVTDAVLGEGGMGVVLSARHRFLGTHAAVKVLHGTYAGNQSATQRFFQEAKASIDIGHADVVKVLDFGQTDRGELYLVMELLEGRSLAAHLAATNRPLRESMTSRIGIGIADVLTAAHAKGIIHRDLKPENVFLASYRVKVLDFGIAKVLSSSAATQTGALLGTPHYMAPEQARGDRNVTPAVDIYALGVMLFEMSTGRLPFVGDNVHALLGQHIDAPPPKPSRLAPVSARLQALILSCLEKQASARPASMNDVAIELERIVAVTQRTAADDWLELHAPPRPNAHDVGFADTSPIAAVGERSSTLRSAAAELFASRRTRVGVGAFAALVSVTLGGAALWWMLRASNLKKKTATPIPAVATAVPAHPEPIATPLQSPPDTPHYWDFHARIDSIPSGAAIFDASNGKLIGATPFNGFIARTGRKRSFRVRHAGYKDRLFTIDEDHDFEVEVTFKGKARALHVPDTTSKTRDPAPVGNTVIDPF